MGQVKKRSQLLRRALQDERARYAVRSGARRFGYDPRQRKVVGMGGGEERVSMVVDGGMIESGAVKSWKAVRWCHQSSHRVVNGLQVQVG